MHLNADISSALQQIEAIKKSIDESDDAKLQLNTSDSLKLILDVLQDPVFRSIVQVQDNLAELNTQLSQHPSMLPNDFDIDITGNLILNTPMGSDSYESEYPDEQRVPSAQLSPKSPNSSSGNIIYLGHDMSDDNYFLKKIHSGTDFVNSGDEERPQSVVSDSSKHNTEIFPYEWTFIQAIELINDGTGLGFGIIGGRSSGVIVKTILAGGVADRDGRLQSGDHILQIGDVNLHDMVSEQVASVLRQSGTHVRLVVARPAEQIKQKYELDFGCAIVPSRLLLDPNELERYLIAAGYPKIFGENSTPSTPLQLQESNFSYVSNDEENRLPLATSLDFNDLELPETETFQVELTKDINGLGITIAGYVCEKEELSGIFVKSVSPGSAADLSDRIRVNDRIIEVDGQSLQGFCNHQAVEVLKKSGIVVKLRLERYLRGPKYEQLQQAIAANEVKPPSLPTTPARNLSNLSNLSKNSLSSSFLSSEDRELNSFKDIPKSNESFDIKQEENSQIIFSGQNKFMNIKDSLDNTNIPSTNVSPIFSKKVENKSEEEKDFNSTKTAKSKYYIEPELTQEIESDIIKKWNQTLGNEIQIIVAQITKFAASSGLGISLEGTVDVECGREVRPHHYIRSILPEGPVGQNGLLKSGDELLEVNGQRLLGMNHLEVVSILKELPQDVRMVCGRGKQEIIKINDVDIIKKNIMLSGSQNLENLLPTSDRLVKAKSDGSLATSSTTDDNFSKLKSRSLEPLTGLAMWSSEPQIIELVKGERGLGFSILDYQDPLDPNDTLIVIRSLVPGGVAQLDGRLIPGDRLLFVNSINLENASLDQAVQALKGAPKGIVRIGVAKPLPMSDNSLKSITDNSNITANISSIAPDIIIDSKK